MDENRLNQLYEAIKNTTDIAAKNDLFAELGKIISKYGEENFTKMEFLEIYCASVENADPKVINFILNYDYKNNPKPSINSKSWKTYHKVTDVASKAQVVYSGFDTIAVGFEHHEIQRQIDEETSKPNPDFGLINELVKQRDEDLVKMGSSSFQLMGGISSFIPTVGQLLEQYFNTASDILNYGYNIGL